GQERAHVSGGGEERERETRNLKQAPVAAAHAMAEERRNQSGFSSASQSSNIKSSFKPVIDGSVLKSDTRQRLAKERREEKKRQQDANKETQLLEKERKSRIQYEKLMEEKQRKLKEQKEKDEQRRISAEEKRKQKLQEERERFKAVVYRTLERSNRVDHRQKRWSWEGSTTMNPETKNETTEKRSSSLNRRSNKLQSPMETEKVEEKPGNRYPVLQYVTTPLRGHSSDELKNTIVLRKSAMAVPPQEKVGALPKAKVEAPPKASTSMEVASNVNVGAIPKVSVEVDPEANMEAAPEVNEATPQASMEGSPEGSAEALPDSVETSPEVSVDMSLEVSVDPSPEVSMDSSLEMSTDASPDGSMQVSSEASVEASTKAGMAASPKASVETLPEESVEASPEAFLEVSVETSSKVKVRDFPQKPEMDKQANNPGTKKRPSSQIPCYKWPSSPASGWRPPSPISVNRQMQKNRPPSPSPVRSKQSQPSLCYKVIPVQRNLLAQNVLGTLGKKREAVSKTTSSSEAVSQKQTVCEGNKSTPGTMNAEEATKILAEKRRLAREQREKEERLQKETEERKVKEMAEKGVDTQGEEFSKLEDGQRRDEMKKGCTDPEDQKVLLQKGDTKIKADEEADKRKKEHERIMLQNLQERLERKKRIEEIMKRTRKTYSNTSQVAAETFSDNTYEEDEADDEDESESDDDSFNDLHPSAFINGMDSSTKFKTHFKNMKKNTPKLVFLDATSGQVHRETKTFFNGDMKTFRPKIRILTQTSLSRPSSKRMSSRATKTRKASETSNTPKIPPERFHHIPSKSPDAFR
uniref:MAP7 domain containing 3 n=1 Tax=Panthera tigris altaica TaxID=74533 RepID=A0A8C9KT31_PANTA